MYPQQLKLSGFAAGPVDGQFGRRTTQGQPLQTTVFRGDPIKLGDSRCKVENNGGAWTSPLISKHPNPRNRSHHPSSTNSSFALDRPAQPS